MKKTIAALVFLLALPGSVFAGQTQFQHIVVVVQENRTPDNLFYGLCQYVSCSTTPNAAQYDIKTSNWLDKTAAGGVTQPSPEPLVTAWDMNHLHSAFNKICDVNYSTTTCAMDGANDGGCAPAAKCPARAAYSYVDNSTGILNPYFLLTGEYGWANYMFQTNQGPSLPAHQFLFGGSSAPNATDDQQGIFVSENIAKAHESAGCNAPPDQTVQLINSSGVESPGNKIFPCYERTTLSDLLDDAGIRWRYYATHGATINIASIWNAPSAIQHICVANAGACSGPLYTGNVDLKPADVFTDIAKCNLRAVSWVTPSGQNSDHALTNTGGGPDWVASIANAVGNSACTNKDGSSYWDSTAIMILWDDWGGWYDHEPPTILAGVQGGYQYGFRVPFVFVSAYTPPRFVSNTRYDFGSILRTIEANFGLPEGVLAFADSRASTDLSEFYSFNQAPRAYRTIPTSQGPKDFLNDKQPELPPDDD